MTLAEELSRYAHSLRFEDLDDATLSSTKDRIIDAFGCAIGGYKVVPAVITRKIAEKIKTKNSATLWGTKQTTTPPLAAFVNGIMVRYFDYNDTYLSKEPAHPSDNIPTCVAAAEATGASGKQLLTAIALAYEIQCRLADAADIRHRGWDHVCYGLVSVALSTGKLLGLNVDQLTQAVNLSLNSHITMRQVRSGELSMWKGCSFAEAARNALFSVMLAKEGITGPAPIFEGDMGFWKQISGKFDIDTNLFGGREGAFKINETSIKYFPAEYHSQSAIWAALDLRKNIGNLDDIVGVEVSTQEAGFTILGNDPAKWNPTTKETADHSLPYIVGRALLDGKIDNSTYQSSKLKDKKIIEFMKKIKVFEDKSITAIYPKRVANKVTVKLASGKILSKKVEDPRGHPYNPMTREEIMEKFNTLTLGFLPSERRKKIIATIYALDKAKTLGNLVTLLAVN